MSATFNEQDRCERCGYMRWHGDDCLRCTGRLTPRPTTSNADEWQLWLQDCLQSEPASGCAFLAVQIVEAIEEHQRALAREVCGLAEDTSRYGDVAMEDRPEGHYYRGRIDEAKSIARAINAIMPYSRDPAALAHGKLHRELARDHVDEVEHLRAVNAQVVAILTEAVVAHGPLGDDARPSWWAKANAALSGNPKCCRGLAPLPECACAQWEAQEEYARRRGVKNVLPHPFPDAPETKKTPATP